MDYFIIIGLLSNNLLGPYAQTQKNKKCFLWQDNAGLHKVAALDNIYTENGITVGYLPPNTTYMLQVLDLVVNGPLKACIRRNRVQHITEYFQKFHEVWELEKEKPETERIAPKWCPPKPTLNGAVLFLLGLMQTSAEDGFCSASFQDSIKRCFIKVGCAPTPDKSFQLYSDTSTAGSMPSLSLAPAGTVYKFESHADELIDENDVLVDVTDFIFENAIDDVNFDEEL